MDIGPSGALAALVDTELSQVWFVRDYVQLMFEDDGLTRSLQFFVWPVVNLRGKRFIFGDPGYRDSLCSFIDQSVVGTEEAHSSGLVLHFDQGTLEMNPSVEELVGPEIAMLHELGTHRGGWMVWRPGEDAFEHLV
jgi:hypothetical protein